MGINFILGLPTNAYALWLSITEARRGAVSDIFVLNQSLCEVLCCLGVVLCSIYMKSFWSCSTGPVVAFLGIFCTARPIFLACICVERYLAVVHPVTFLRFKPLRYRVLCSAVTWLTILGDSFVTFFNLNSVPLLYVILGQSLAFFFVKCFCCLETMRALKQPGPREGDRTEMNKAKVKAFRVILIVLLCSIVNYIPMVVSLSLFGFLSFEEFLFSCTLSLSVMVMTGFVQPLLYLYRMAKLPHIKGCWSCLRFLKDHK
ncbi:uracil nucleotide/cysteinyl leukotriene receptor-like [Chanos chanos]|uniref:Uracil nucleotide/cysteinyl leukotriene receptor-like n=1 Tax=Chanos chanos TaxID=29144 RepID=A0A6J2WK01_CHACN|nr:uracil nucleotide/cysteinyl leukotriene receptor-like [Chanos chanos]